MGKRGFFWKDTVDGRNPAPLIGSLSHYLPCFIHPRWCRISSINSMKCDDGDPLGGRVIYDWEGVLVV